MAKVHTLVVGRLQTNCYILQSDSAALVVDPEPNGIIATHTHFDHVLGVDSIRAKLTIPFLIHHDDLSTLESMQKRVRQIMGFSVPPPPKVDRFLKDGESIAFGEDQVKVIHTPGHSPGSISLAGQGFVLTGDALFNQSIGRTDLPGGDLDTLIRSITKRLFTLDNDTIVYPGHGPETSIGDEKLANPFVGQVAKRIP